MTITGAALAAHPTDHAAFFLTATGTKGTDAFTYTAKIKFAPYSDPWLAERILNVRIEDPHVDIAGILGLLAGPIAFFSKNTVEKELTTQVSLNLRNMVASIITPGPNADTMTITVQNAVIQDDRLVLVATIGGIGQIGDLNLPTSGCFNVVLFLVSVFVTLGGLAYHAFAG